MTSPPPAANPYFPVTRNGVGAAVPRPDGPAKVAGDFTFASDLRAPGMLYGRTLRSPHPHAVVRKLDTSKAERLRGVDSILTAAALGCRPMVGLERRDQPVLAGVGDEVRYAGEPVALVAAATPGLARRAIELIEVDYEELAPALDPIEAVARGDWFRQQTIRAGDPREGAEVVVHGFYEVGQQDQAPLGPEAGLVIPDGIGGIDVWTATQALHADLGQLTEALGLSPERCRIHLAGVGGAFGAREDLSMQLHASLLALRTGRPVKMWYGREESFLGHVHRHPALMWYEHGAGRDGKLVFVRATIVLDGGAYASTSPAVVMSAAAFACGPYRVPNALIWCAAARTNHAPNGAMRGFGAVQVCFGHESQMDRLAAALGVDPIELRRRNALRPGDRLVTGQLVGGGAPVLELIERCQSLPLPDFTRAPALTGGAGRLTRDEDVRRGVGFALGFKNVAFAEGADDSAQARVRLERRHDRAVAVVKTAAVEMGQGIVTVCQQIVRTELGVDEVELEPADTLIGPAGSSSASRQTWMTGGAVRDAAAEVRAEVLRRAGAPAHGVAGGHVIDVEGMALAPIATFLETPIEHQSEFHHRKTNALDSDGQGDAFVALMFAAQRAVVEVDPEAGLVAVTQVTTALDVGRAINPMQVHGQIEGAVAQGVGLAVMEEIVQRGGRIVNASFTDYLLPTTLDMPEVLSALVEHAQPEAPYGLNGVGEAPLIASPAAICAAMRAATGRSLVKIPVTPDHLTGLQEVTAPRQVVPGEQPLGSDHTPGGAS